MKKLIGIAVAILGVSILAATQVFAVINENIQLRNNSVGIAVSPGNSDRLEFVPGDYYEGSFRVRQVGRETNKVFAEVTPYSAGAESDYENSNFYNPNASTEIVNWITLNLDKCDIDSRQGGKIYFTMRPREECFVKYRIAIPLSAKGGSQRAAIFVQSEVREGQNQGLGGVESSYRMGYMIYADIDGPDARFSGRVIENNIPWLFFDPPIFVTNKLENSGNSDFNVKYEMEAKNVFSGASNFTSEKDKMVFADSTRADKITWEGSPFLGMFNVTQKITFLDETSEVTRLVLIVPIWLIIIVAVVIALLIIARVMKTRERRRNRRV